MNPLPAQLTQLEKSLLSKLAGEAYFDPHRRALYATDASLYQVYPAGVVLPKNRRDVELTVELAAEHGVPVISRGSGTSLSGQSIGPGIVIDFSKYMNRLLELDPDRSTARVEPGIVLDTLNTTLAPYGLQFGPDVATSNRANLGGMIGNNSGRGAIDPTWQNGRSRHRAYRRLGRRVHRPFRADGRSTGRFEIEARRIGGHRLSTHSANRAAKPSGDPGPIPCHLATGERL